MTGEGLDRLDKAVADTPIIPRDAVIGLALSILNQWDGLPERCPIEQWDAARDSLAELLEMRIHEAFQEWTTRSITSVRPQPGNALTPFGVLVSAVDLLLAHHENEAYNEWRPSEDYKLLLWLRGQLKEAL